MYMVVQNVRCSSVRLYWTYVYEMCFAQKPSPNKMNYVVLDPKTEEKLLQH
jgi:hypothetical protein